MRSKEVTMYCIVWKDDQTYLEKCENTNLAFGASKYWSPLKLLTDPFLFDSVEEAMAAISVHRDWWLKQDKVMIQYFHELNAK